LLLKPLDVFGVHDADPVSSHEVADLIASRSAVF